MARTRHILKDWSSHFPGVNRLFFPLIDKARERPESLEDTKGHDRTVCQFLSDICPEAGCYFLLARVTHEVTEDCGTVSAVTHTIDGVSTPHGLDLPIVGSVDARREILGFSQYDLELREADSDDLEDNPEWACEEGEYSRRYHDTAALIIPREQILDVIDSGKLPHYVRSYDDNTFRHQAVENLINMLTTGMESFPDDQKTRQVLLDMLTRLSGDGEILRAPAVERILELSLESGDMDLYSKTIAVTSFATSSDSMRVAKLIEPHLVKEYIDKGNTVNWNDWLGPLTERNFQDFRQSCTSLKHGIENEALSLSLDAWVLDALDLKMETQQKWEYSDCRLALDWISERSEKPDWILNKFLPNIAAHASRTYLLNLMYSLWKRNGDPGFLNAPAMCRSIIQHGFEKLEIRAKDFDYSGIPEDDTNFFVLCIEESHVGGLPEEASRLIAATSAGLAKSRQTWNLQRNYGRANSIMQRLVAPLAGLIARGRAVPVPEFGELVELLVRHSIRTTLPPFPPEPDGWTYDSSGCSCSDCRELKKFLVSPKRRKHIESMLLVDAHCFRVETTRNRSPYTLVVTKTGGEHQLKVARWQDAYQQLRILVAPFRNQPMRGCLGDEKYRELILLEDYAQHAAPAGVRRRATSTVDEPELQRRRVM
ncbi:hypothetical protein LCI18_007253 [Fusarium solani-melongenae]|uniref:Uncharacterized protein n=1 Tax=Fusarium solani subsp. cucurbitae TaxID=2747967 RepID=A0ACD3Z8B9_FUSSC|nr:hypothetical protein LCI18_007253 [Fusarium solani-melongenae]